MSRQAGAIIDIMWEWSEDLYYNWAQFNTIEFVQICFNIDCELNN